MNAIQVQLGLRDWLQMQGMGRMISSQWTIAHGATITPAAAVDANSDPFKRVVASDVGLLVTDVLADGCASGLDSLDIELTDNNHYRLYFPAAPNVQAVNLLTRGDPNFAIVNGEPSSTIYVTIHALSLDRPTYNWLLSKLAIDNPFGGNQGAVGATPRVY